MAPATRHNGKNPMTSEQELLEERLRHMEESFDAKTKSLAGGPKDPKTFHLRRSTVSGGSLTGPPVTEFWTGILLS